MIDVVIDLIVSVIFAGCAMASVYRGESLVYTMLCAWGSGAAFIFALSNLRDWARRGAGLLLDLPEDEA